MCLCVCPSGSVICSLPIGPRVPFSLSECVCLSVCALACGHWFLLWVTGPFGQTFMWKARSEDLSWACVAAAHVAVAPAEM